MGYIWLNEFRLEWYVHHTSEVGLDSRIWPSFLKDNSDFVHDHYLLFQLIYKYFCDYNY